MWYSVVILCALVGVRTAEAKFYKECGGSAELISVAVTGCEPDAKECVLHRNSTVTFDIVFTAKNPAQSVMTVVHGIIMDLPVPFPLPNPDACKSGGLECPLKENDKCTYQAMLPVLKSYPRVSVQVKWELKNEKEEDIVCLIIPAKLK